MSQIASKTRRYNPAHVFLVCGLVASLFIVMFRPGGVEAALPTEALVFDKYDATTGATVKFGDIPKITDATYSVVPKGGSKGVSATLTGVPLIDFLKKANAPLDNVNFVKVRLGTTNDASVALLSLDQQSSIRPPMILDSGRLAGRGALRTPQLIPGQPTDAPIHETQFAPFNAKKNKLTIIPAKPGAKIMSVRVSAKRKKDGQIRLIARATAGDSGGALEYVWFDASDGKVLGNDDTYVTTDAVGQTRTHQVNVVVTEKTTGSTGVRSYGYTSKKTNDGSSRGPTPSTGGGGSNGTNGGSGGGNGVNGVFPQGNSVNPGTTTTPTPTPPNQTFTPPPTEPTAPTTTPDVPVQSDVDTSAITNVAQNISGNGDLQTVSGVLLSSPTVAPAAGGGGSPIAQLPAPVATELSSVFQPVDDPGDIWPYLITILFGTCLAGAVREWVNP